MNKKYKKYASKMREDLYRKLKIISTAEDRQIQELIEEAVTEYLAKRKIIEKRSETEWTVRYSMEPRVSEPTEPYGSKEEDD